MNQLSLPARNLSPVELEELVNRLATQADLWRDRIALSAREREYVSLFRDDYVDLWLISWTQDGDTGWHDHDISSGAVRVIEGALSEANPRIGGQAALGLLHAGDSLSFGPEHIHRLSGEARRSLSLHAYSPPLWRMGQYSIDEDGVMRRRSISYADELRPLEAALVA